MIEELIIHQVASYDGAPQKLSQLTEFNYFYGSNGAGKTTISKIINDELSFPSCSIKWKDGIRLVPYVYNNSFVEENFNQDKIKGIFTLGSNAREIEESLNELNELKLKEQDGLIRKKRILEGGDEELGTLKKIIILDDELKSSCWKQKVKHDDAFYKAFEGLRNSAEKFKLRVMHEHINNKEEVISLEELTYKSSVIFSGSIKNQPLIRVHDFSRLKEIGDEEVWHEKITGKENVSVSELINLLNNSDWVSEGIKFYEKSAPKCPFCQQETQASLLKDLADYYDDIFNKKKQLVERIGVEYVGHYNSFENYVKQINESGIDLLDLNLFNDKASLLLSTLRENISKIRNKMSSLSERVDIVGIEECCKDVVDIISAANNKIEENNIVFHNKKEKGEKLVNQIWAYIIKIELAKEIKAYNEEKNRLTKQKAGLEKGIQAHQDNIEKIKVRIEEQEAKQTSVQPTIIAINKLLRSFGFRNFRLSASHDNNHYNIVREGGVDASKTLSEGEKTFITFLYFYNLIKGSNNSSGILDERIVVFDDPISSLDSDILFIVSSLMKNVIDDVKNKKCSIRQVFFLTHNVYFHKELTFNPKRTADAAMTEETFWVVKKKDKASIIERHNTNPIKTSYDLLWSEIRSGDTSSYTIQNTLRRIIENYFKILGGMDVRKLEVCFNGEEKIIFNSLISWINDGSHFSSDDLYVALDEESTKKYLIVFQKIFEKSDHTAHYKMMMGKSYRSLEDEVLEDFADLDSANDGATGIVA